MTRLTRRDVLRSGVAGAGLAALATGPAGLLDRAVAQAATSGGPAGPPPPVPQLDTLRGEWMTARSLLNRPSVNNFHGGLRVGPDLGSVELLTFPPFSQGGRAAQLTVDGRSVTTRESAWYPYQVVRRGGSDGLALESRTRMGFEESTVLLEVDVENTTAATREVTVALRCSGFVRRFDQRWDWSVPRPGDTSGYTGSLHDGGAVLAVTDPQTGAATAFAFPTPPDDLSPAGTDGTASWSLALVPGQRRTLRVVLAVAADAVAAAALAGRTRVAFDERLSGAADDWQARFEAAFTPGNDVFSGHLPLLATDDADLHRVYYHSVACILHTMRTNYPTFPRVYATAGPQWATTLTYFWDTSLFAGVWSLLDPEMVRAQTRRWLELGIYGGYAVDHVSGQLSGPWYSANDLSVFRTIHDYVRWTGDLAYLDERVGERTVLEHLDAIATNWTTLVRPGTELADYGEMDNLLEVGPHYVHQVASLNAANVWLMRRAADLREAAGGTARAAELRALADRLSGAVRALYVAGEGVWYSRNRDGTLAEVRHVYDFLTVGAFMAEDLTPTQRTEMRRFVDTELRDSGWLRAMSPLDDYAAASDRPDHGPNGAYDAWPAHTAQALARLGSYPAAVSMLRDAVVVLDEGPFAQSHEFTSGPRGLQVDGGTAAVDPTAALSVAAWIRPDSWPDQVFAASILAKEDWTSGERGYVLRGGDGGRLSWVVAVDGSYRVVETTDRVEPGAWHHVAATYDGSRMAVFVDGVERAAAAVSGPLSPSVGTPVLVASHPLEPGRVFDGGVDDVRVYGRALTPAEIAALVADQVVDSTDLALHLPFDEGSGATARDLVGGGSYALENGSWTTRDGGPAVAFDADGAAQVIRIAQRGGQDFNENNGGAFADVALREVFGYVPDGRAPLLRDADIDRGVRATLHGVAWQGLDYDITSGANGLTLARSTVPCPAPVGNVVIRGVDSGVAERAGEHGCSIGELLRADDPWPSHGAFVRHVRGVADDLHRSGTIDGRERGRLTSAAARSRSGRPHG